MIGKVLRSKWFWIGIVIFAVLTYGAAKEWSRISELKKEAKALKESNDKLKADAVTKDSQFNAKMGDANQRTAEISKQMVVLQRDYQDILKRNAELVKLRLEQERLYAESDRKMAQITIPAGRTDRVKLLNVLGY